MRTSVLGRICITALCSLILFVSQDSASRRPAAATLRPSLRVLFVGNSYTLYNDLPWVTQQLALSDPGVKPIHAESVAMMGATLKEHWNDGFALKRIKEGGPWDYVVLQEQSHMPLVDPVEMSKYASLFDHEIDLVGAKTVLLVTWSPRGHPEQQAKITNVYAKLARELDAKLAPVGTTWQSALASDAGLKLYIEDADSHPTSAGTYLAACVIYSTLYGKSPAGLTREIRRPETDGSRPDPISARVDEEPFALGEAESSFLQRVAWETASRADGDDVATTTP